MNISYDRFIRTTDSYHVSAIQKIFKEMYEKGDIYKGTYEGMYCTPCESFWTASQLKDGKCPDCGREGAAARRRSYFFRLSKVCRGGARPAGKHRFSGAPEPGQRNGE